MSSDTMLSAALEYARKGRTVFPIKPNAKEPLTVPEYGFTEGFKSATTDEARIRGAWMKHPNANIGYRPRVSYSTLTILKRTKTKMGLRRRKRLKRKMASFR